MSDTSRLLVGCNASNFSASRLAHAVEDCDAHLLNMNVTDLRLDPDAPLVVDLRVNRRNTEALRRSLERYGYTVLLAERTPADGADLTRDDYQSESLRARAREMLYYINL